MYEEPNNDRKGDQADGAAEGKERKRRVPAAVPLSIRGRATSWLMGIVVL